MEKLTISNVEPTDSGTAAEWLTTNLGSVDGALTVAVGAITNSENGRSEVEIAAEDGTDNVGELGGFLKVAFWMDADGSGGWSGGDYYLKSDGTKVSWQTGQSTLPIAAYDVLNSYGGKSWASLQAVNASTDAGSFRVEYSWPDGGNSDNVAQGDSCVFDITFSLNLQ